MLTKDDVGKLFTRRGDDVWRLTALTIRGTMVMEKLEADHAVVGRRDSAAIRQFKRLVVEEK